MNLTTDQLIRLRNTHPEIYAEFRDALDRTGPTPALIKAANRLPALLAMHPAAVEARMATGYLNLK